MIEYMYERLNVKLNEILSCRMSPQHFEILLRNSLDRMEFLQKKFTPVPFTRLSRVNLLNLQIV
jgi:hypothetical protein